ncbi:MAG TPA: DedA family protein [Mycobacteriales bacterium]
MGDDAKATPAAVPTAAPHAPEPPDEERTDGTAPRAAAGREPLDLAAALEHIRPGDVVCLGGIFLSVALGFASYPLAAFLLAHVKIHLVATASISALLTGGAAAYAGTIPLWLVLVLAVIGLAKFDPFYFWAGRRYGDNVAHFIEQYGSIKPRTVARAERWVARFGPPLLTISFFVPIPTRLVMVLLGASGVSWLAFAIADFVGTMAWIGLYIAVGHHFHAQVDHVAHVVNHYSILIGLGLLGVVIAISVVRGMRMRPTAPPS